MGIIHSTPSNTESSVQESVQKAYENKLSHEISRKIVLKPASTQGLARSAFMFAARLSSFELCDANEFALLALSLPASVRAECAIYLCARLVC